MKESTEIEKQDGKNSGRKRDILTEKENKDRKRKEERQKVSQREKKKDRRNKERKRNMLAVKENNDTKRKMKDERLH